MAIISFLWQIYCFNLDNGHLKAENHVADKNLLFSVEDEKIKGGLGFPLCKFCKKNLRGYSCANGGGASTDSVGRRTLEETNLVVGHSNTKTTLTQGWLGVAIVITSNILSRAERALSLTQTDSCVLRSRRWLLSERKARCP